MPNRRMRLALIPPYTFSGYMLMTDYQLLLPQCFHSEKYTKTVYRMREEERSNYIILDNGAAEGEAWHPQALVAVGREFSVDEIIIPDMLGDYDGTLDLLEFFEDETTPEDRERFKWMGVLQGNTMAQVIQCAKVYADKPYITTLGIPRHLLMTLGDKLIRAEIAGSIAKIFKDRFQVHFLGMNPTWYMEPRVLRIAAPWARGLDTSLPFVASMEGAVIDDPDCPIVGRPKHYFDAQAYEFSVVLIDYNISVLRGWLSG